MPRPQIPSTSALDALTGRRLPGGCDDCTAFQIIKRVAEGFFVLTVHHDDTCPLAERPRKDECLMTADDEANGDNPA